MLFNSLTFAIFLPIVFLLYWFVFQRNLRLQNLFAVAASYVFYGWWDWRFLFLIAFTTLCSYWTGLKIQNSKFKVQKSKIWLIFNVVLNLAILGIFKYYNFFVESFVEMFADFGIVLQARTLSIILPVGISFYTFQALSYSIDIYRKKIEPTRDLLAFAAYIGFFPLLVAGPIERATNMLPQFLKKRSFDYNSASDGMRQILWGLFKKIVIADNCAIYVNQVFDSYQIQSGSTLAIAAVLFAFQIYGDFSGYSDIAIGTARLFGINAMRNFNIPYFSRDIAEFWRRWHISLTTWFRDYVYIPLGGSRVSKMKVVRNTFIIFLLSGFWHGANWTFVTWGAFHALLFLPLILLNKNRKYTNIAADGQILPSLKEFLQMTFTFLLVVAGWIFFRAKSFTDAIQYICSIFDNNLISKPLLINRGFYIPLAINIFILLAVEWLTRTRQHGLQIDGVNKKYLRWVIYLTVSLLIYQFGVFQYTQFIYFQF